MQENCCLFIYFVLVGLEMTLDSSSGHIVATPKRGPRPEKREDDQEPKEQDFGTSLDDNKDSQVDVMLKNTNSLLEMARKEKKDGEELELELEMTPKEIKNAEDLKITPKEKKSDRKRATPQTPQRDEDMGTVKDKPKSPHRVVMRPDEDDSVINPKQDKKQGVKQEHRPHYSTVAKFNMETNCILSNYTGE